MKYRVLIVEDDPMSRQLFELFVEQSDRYEVVESIENAEMADIYCVGNKIDLIVMDICTANNSNGIAYAKIVKENHPNIKIIIMTGILDVSFINEAKQIGIESFIYKNISKDSLVSTIKNTANGYSIYPNSNRKENTSDSILSELTDKEMQILKLYCRLLDKDAVAEALSISPRTLKSHIHSIYDKTGFNNLAKLAIYCVSNGFIVSNLDEP